MWFYPNWWRKNFLTVELCVAVLLSAGLLIWWRYGSGIRVLTEIVHGSRSQIYGTLASIFGSLLGFVITALSVVLGFSSADRLKILRGSSYYKQLWDVFTSAIRVLGFTTLIWLGALFFDRESAPKPLLFVFCLAFSFLAVLRLARCVWVLERIVEALTLKSD
jgi:hypothetical protein